MTIGFRSITLPGEMQIRNNALLDARFERMIPLAIRVDKDFFFINNIRSKLYFDRINSLFNILKENNLDYSQRYSLIIKETGEVTVKDMDGEIYRLKKNIKRISVIDRFDLLNLRIRKTLLEKLEKLKKKVSSKNH
jgi:hypothetical protein